MHRPHATQQGDDLVTTRSRAGARRSRADHNRKMTDSLGYIIEQLCGELFGARNQVDAARRGRRGG